MHLSCKIDSKIYTIYCIISLLYAIMNGVRIKEWALLYQTLLRCLWTKSIVCGVRLDDWTAELAIIASVLKLQLSDKKMFILYN